MELENIAKHFNTSDKANNTLRRTMITVIVICCLSMFALAGALVYIFIESSGNIFVMDKGGNIATAFKKDIEGEKKAEIDNHMRMIYDTFFTYDSNNVKSQTAKGLSLMGEEGRLLNQTYISSGWYNNVIQNNLSSTSYIDSIKIDASKEPYQIQAYGKQRIRRFNIEEVRELDVTGSLYNVARVIEKNPHGLEASFKITDNRTISLDSLNIKK